MILLLHMGIHLIASSISTIIMPTLAPIAIMMLQLRLWTLSIQSIIVIALNKFHYKVLGNLLLRFITKYFNCSS